MSGLSWTMLSVQLFCLSFCLLTANCLYFVFRRYKVSSSAFLGYIFCMFQDSLPDHKHVLVNIYFDHLSLLFQSGNVICGSYIFMVVVVSLVANSNTIESLSRRSETDITFSFIKRHSDCTYRINDPENVILFHTCSFYSTVMNLNKFQ